MGLGIQAFLSANSSETDFLQFCLSEGFALRKSQFEPKCTFIHQFLLTI
ncbi:hypothetical protein PSE_p0251 (plasmid) [Pseudovibrio sp. FO-BEG1]|nr:hypothetical protein PSE_p0251 [Pseudovibrio sp. FO-BEG1]